MPNFDSRLRKRSEKFGGWRHLRPLEHITHFTPATLRDAFTRAGLEPVAVGSPSYAGPPQTLDEALDDLVRARWKPGLAILPKKSALTDYSYRLAHAKAHRTATDRPGAQQ